MTAGAGSGATALPLPFSIAAATLAAGSASAGGSFFAALVPAACGMARWARTAGSRFFQRGPAQQL
jgi:hypothetical protein